MSESFYNPNPSGPVIRDPVLYEIVTQKDEALNSYLDNEAKYGTDDIRTQMSYSIFVLKSYVMMIHEAVEGMKGITLEFQNIMKELDSLFDMGLGSAGVFYEGLDKYPNFLRNWIATRRAKKYYNRKLGEFRTMMNIQSIRINMFPKFFGFLTDSTSTMIGSISKVMKGDFTLGGKSKKKKGGFQIETTINDEIQRARDARSGKPSSGPDASMGGSSVTSTSSDVGADSNWGNVGD